MKKILIVDDEFLILYSLSMTLRRDDREVKTVANGKDALKELGNRRYDLCFLDVRLPDMNGLDIMRTVKKISPTTKIIIMTASEITSAMMESIQESAQLLMSKPFDLFRVTAYVDQLLAPGEPFARDGCKTLEEYAPFTG